MRTITTSSLLRTATIVSLAAFVLWTALFLMYGITAEGKLGAATFPTFLDGYKAIGTGFLVAILVVLVPQLLPEEKYRFERLKDSRVAYSKARTGIAYLPTRISKLSLDGAVELIQSVHQDLHVAQTYEELASHLAPYETPEKWGPLQFRTLKAIKLALEQRMVDWDAMQPTVRLEVVRAAIETVKPAN